MLMINEALKKFGADRTGMVDFALESAGKNNKNVSLNER